MTQEKNWNELASSYKELFTELNEVDEALAIIHKLTDSYTKIEVISIQRFFHIWFLINFHIDFVLVLICFISIRFFKKIKIIFVKKVPIFVMSRYPYFDEK